jgi:ATP-dependent DNA ligase
MLWQGAGHTIASLNQQELSTQLTDLESTGQYIAEIKEDGHYTTIFAEESANQFYSRNQKRQKVAELDRLELPDGLIVAGELGTGTQYAVNKRNRLGHEYAIVHRILATPEYLHESFPSNAMELSEVEQRRLLELIWSGLDETTKKQIQLASRFSSNFSQHYRDTVDQGGEGLVLKAIDPNLNTRYQAGSHSQHWIKVKKTITVDFVITSIILSSAETFKGRGMASSIVCGAYRDGEIQNICTVGTMDHDHRQLFGQQPDQYIGRVVEIGGFEQFSSGALRHPWFIRLRGDKTPAECTLQREDI